MPASHISADLFARWLDGEVDDLTLLKALLPHAVSQCPDCSSAWRQATAGRVPGQGLLAELQHAETNGGADPREAIERALTQLRGLKEEVLGSAAAEEIEDDLGRLLNASAGTQLRMVEKDPQRYGRPRLVLGLLRRSRSLAPRDPELSEHLASLACQAAASAPHPRRRQQAVVGDLLALGMALQGNARRLLGEYKRAEEMLDESLTVLDAGSGDPLVFADLLGYRGSLLRDLSRLAESEKVVRRAVQIYRRCGEEHQAGRALLKLATIQGELGGSAAAVRTVRSALGLLDFRVEPFLHEVAYRNLALYTAEVGDPAKGLEILKSHPPMERTARRSLLEREWAEGRILALAGQEEAAMAALDFAREGFAEINDAPNASVSTLELALLYLEKGRVEDVRRLAGEAVPMLFALDLSDRATAGLILFQQATEAETISIELLRRIRKSFSDPKTWRQLSRAN